MIEGVKVIPLRRIPDERGTILHMLRATDPHFQQFGEIYFSTVRPGVVKGWHLHERMVINYAVVHGLIKLVLFDDREKSPTKGAVNEFFLGFRNMVCVQVPALVWHGFKCTSEEEAIIINVPNEPYHHASPDEYRKPWNDASIPYTWDRQNG